MHVMLMFLAINAIETDYSDNELIEVILRMADNSISYLNFLKWLESHIKIVN